MRRNGVIFLYTKNKYIFKEYKRKGDKMLKIRLEGLVDDVDDGVEILRKHFEVLKDSDIYPNRYGKYVRRYMDVNFKIEEGASEQKLKEMLSSLNYFIFEEVELDEGYEDKLIAGFVMIQTAKQLSKMLNAQSSNCHCVKNRFGSFV